MKTAEEWVHNQDTKLSTCFGDFRQSLSSLTFSYESEHTDAELEEFVKQIQLDAMKEGMRRAADEVEMKGVGIIERQTVNGKFDAWMYRGSMKEAILTAAEQLTEKDL